MITVLTSGKAAPGTTTSAWALSLAWPVDLLTADLDEAGGDMAAGFLAGRIPVDRGLMSWSAENRHAQVLRATNSFQDHVIAVPEAEKVWLLAGLQSGAQSAAFTTDAWTRLARAFERSTSVLGRDVLVDTGRLGDATCWPVLQMADQVILTVRPTVRSVHGAVAAAARLHTELGDLAKVSALVVGDGRYAAGEVASALAVPLRGVLPTDRDTAATLSDGMLGGLRGLRKSPLVKAARVVTDSLLGQSTSHLTARLAVR